MLGNQGKKAWHVNPIDLTHQTSAATFGLLSAVGPDAHAMIVLANVDDGLVYANMSAAPVGFSQPLVPVYPGIHPSALVMTAISAPHPAQDLVMVLPGEAESSPDTLAWMANTHGSGHELSTPIPVFSNASMSRPILADVDGDGLDDVLVFSSSSPAVWLVRNKGSDGGLDAPVLVYQGPAEATVTAIAVGHFPGPRADIIVAVENSSVPTAFVVRVVQTSPMTFVVGEYIAEPGTIGSQVPDMVTVPALVPDGPDTLIISAYTLAKIFQLTPTGSAAWNRTTIPSKTGAVRLLVSNLFDSPSAPGRDLAAMGLIAVMAYPATSGPSTFNPSPTPIILAAVGAVVVCGLVLAMVFIIRRRRNSQRLERSPLLGINRGA
ncbi:uncharacterized protein AMSG_11125 [Thecamonas trahens ATCC 50062]|uniref:VCBS repeat-containing protein n=1 Tax=Thecamonas trahens ATCC 50062 TaxID=461836 RepID=A0A0L0DTR9_THETB|nr:hypothetical protein AMSG_11125 [Thecamonas trahens ATCC 50062]KNC55729.1 hypothetical protein AMSG_11125 [Thecamonas trahens ATCC 50062]|eukprot:XP_013752884.1 hypothetical protein AMSG_11125 [Thecamonas trahens ATCC 50062]